MTIETEHPAPARFGVVPAPEMSPDELVAEIREVQRRAAAELWRMGDLLGKLYERKNYWSSNGRSWNAFTLLTFDLTGPYVLKLVDCARAFTERQIIKCGTAKLIKILPVPEADRKPMFEAAMKGATVKEIRASVNRYMLNAADQQEKRNGHRRLSYRETERHKAPRIRTIRHVNAAEQVIELWSFDNKDRRALSVEDKPFGRATIGALDYEIRVRRDRLGFVQLSLTNLRGGA